MKSLEPDSLAITIRNLRKVKGWTQKKLALYCGVHDVTISYVETGRRLPSHKLLRKIAEGFGMRCVVKFEDII